MSSIKQERVLCFYLTTVYVQFIHKICNLWYARRTKKLIEIAFYRLSHTIAMDSVWLIHITDDCNCNIFSSQVDKGGVEGKAPPSDG